MTSVNLFVNKEFIFEDKSAQLLLPILNAYAFIVYG